MRYRRTNSDRPLTNAYSAGRHRGSGHQLGSGQSGGLGLFSPAGRGAQVAAQGLLPGLFQQQVRLGHHAHQVICLIQHREAADVQLTQHGNDVLVLCGLPDRHDICGHHVFDAAVHRDHSFYSHRPGPATARPGQALALYAHPGAVRRRRRFARKAMWLILDTAADGTRRVAAWVPGSGRFGLCPSGFARGPMPGWRGRSSAA